MAIQTDQTLTIFESPIGPLTLIATAVGVCGLEFGAASASDGQTSIESSALDKKIPAHAHLFTAIKQLEEYFAGKRKAFDVPLAYPYGTPFQQATWDALRTIPYGSTWSYKGLATAVGNPKAARAVGSANNRNPIAIIVPCHRVIASDGSLAGFAGELWRKSALLDLESNILGRQNGQPIVESIPKQK